MEKIEIKNQAGERKIFTLDYEHGKGEESLEEVRGFTQNFNINLTYERSPFQQGATTVAMRTSVRPLSFVLNILRRTKQEVDLRVRDIVTFLNPYEGELEVTYDNGTRRRSINAYYREHSVVDENSSTGYAALAIELVADEALFKDSEDKVINLGDAGGSFAIPFTPPFTLGLSQIETIVNNTGDYHYPVEIKFFGEVSNPKIVRYFYENGSDTVVDTAKLEFENLVIPENSFVRINTKRGEEEVTLVDSLGNEENINRYLSPDSTFFQIFVGKNRISLETTTGNPATEIKYRQKYITA